MAVTLFGACGCERPNPVEPEKNPHDTTVVEPEDLIWSGRPYFNITLENTEAEPVKLPIQVRITTDTKKLAVEMTDTVEVAGNTQRNYAVTTTENLERRQNGAQFQFRHRPV